MTLQVGVIGTGMIGRDHIRRISRTLSGVEVVAVTDADLEVAGAVAQELPGAAVLPAGRELIAADSVEAVVVTSWGPTHEEFVLAAIEAGKPVFCEKPMATTQDACRRILEAEVAGGRRLVQVGFMRRYDAGYRALKDLSDSGTIGAPLMFHSVHRNASVPAFFTSEMAIVDTAVHDFDVTRWLLGEELVAIRVLRGRTNSLSGALADPLLILAESQSGVLVDIETSLNIRYGYDIRGEVVGERGAARLPQHPLTDVSAAGVHQARLPQDWRERFVGAFDRELQEWVDAVGAGVPPTGPSAWDGYAATAICDAGVSALHSGERCPVQLADQPAFYQEVAR